MAMNPEELLNDAASRQPGDHVERSVQDLLACWGYRVRDFDSVPHIEGELGAAGLTTDPPFDQAATGAVVRLVPVDAAAATEPEGPEASEEPAEDPDEADAERFTFPQASLLIRDIPSASTGVVSVSPHDPLLLARDKLRGDGCDQVAVLAAPNDLRGVVTWESITRATARTGDPALTDATEDDPEMVRLDGDLLTELPKIYRTGFAFVRDEDRAVCGVVGTIDLSHHFEHLVRPYFLIGEIERRLRRRINEKFSRDELHAVYPKAPSADDFVFKQYEQLLTNVDRWRQMGWSCDHGYFLGKLHEVRLIRNKVMHFKPQPLTDVELTTLENAAKFVRDLDPRH